MAALEERTSARTAICKVKAVGGAVWDRRYAVWPRLSSPRYRSTGQGRTGPTALSMTRGTCWRALGSVLDRAEEKLPPACQRF